MGAIETIIAACFWCSVCGIVYAYLGYPMVIFAFSRLFGRAPNPPVVADADLPTVSLLIAAYNEAGVIEDRIHNALELSYPEERSEIVIASDGSDDGTADICACYRARIRPIVFPVRQGKPATLNAAIPQLDGDIVVLSDANTRMDPEALRHLARWFVDPAVGAVCGRLVLNDPGTGRNADGLYWRYETFLKQCEARLGALLGANGAIYALRRSLFTPLPPGTVVDDFVIPLAAKLHSGCRIVYDEAALAYEESAPNLRAEFGRRSRIGVGGFHALTMLWPLLDPRHGWTAFALWSHKVLRWACPFLLIAAILTAASLVRFPFYRAALIAQAAFYALCVVGALLPPTPASRLLRVLPMFAGMNLALLTGILRGICGRQTGVWARTERPLARKQAA
jgi:cellulose synthase/poly-beta-1,6-N-acetylglucosamine synthase-like glycosyltransferase